MANRAAPALGLREGDREELVRLTRSSSVRAGLAQRARIVLLAADGVSNTAIAELVGVSRPTVIGWRQRYQSRGMAGLDDDPRSGRPRSIDHAAIITATLTPPPEKLGVTHWSTRLLGAELGISHVWVGKNWRRFERGRHDRDLINHPMTPRLRTIFQPADALGGVALLPADHRRLGHPDPLHDVLDRHAVRGQQHDPGPLRQPRLQRRRPQPRLQNLAVSRRHVHGHSQRHAP